MRDKKIRVLLIITLALQGLIIFWTYVPFNKSFILGNLLISTSIMGIASMVLYLIIFFKLLNSRYNYIFSMLLLIIPIYAFCALHIIPVYNDQFRFPTAICLIIISGLGIAALASSMLPDKDVCILIDTDLRIILVFSIVFGILARVGDLVYRRLYYDNKIFKLLVYLPLVFLGILLLLFIILVIHATIEYITLKRVQKRIGFVEKD